MKNLRKRRPWSRVLWIHATFWLQMASAVPAPAVVWPWESDQPWPPTSGSPVAPLRRPAVEDRLAVRPGGPDSPYRFAVFGDQRALADREWPEMIARIAELDAAGSRIEFILDTGDIVTDGRHSDQFHFLANLLEPVAHLPYLVAVGNHELKNNRSDGARANAALFLSGTDDEIAPEHLYYRKDLGAATFLFLDSNDFVYGDRGERTRCHPEVDPHSRTAEQIEWLREQLTSLAPSRLVIAAIHHPLVQASEKHRKSSASLWNLRAGEQTFVDLLVDGGVDLIISGHTHSYELYRLTRHDGREMMLANVSGRPRDAFLWFGSAARRPKVIQGREREQLVDWGWRGLDRWEIVQEDVMREADEADQFAILTVHPDGRLEMVVHFLDESAPGGARRSSVIEIHSGL